MRIRIRLRCKNKSKSKRLASISTRVPRFFAELALPNMQGWCGPSAEDEINISNYKWLWGDDALINCSYESFTFTGIDVALETLLAFGYFIKVGWSIVWMHKWVQLSSSFELWNNHCIKFFGYFTYLPRILLSLSPFCQVQIRFDLYVHEFHCSVINACSLMETYTRFGQLWPKHVIIIIINCSIHGPSRLAFICVSK